MDVMLILDRSNNVLTFFCCVLQASTALNALEDMPGVTPPIGVFDPLKLAETGSDETLAWFRAAELKHGRCAMAAFVGFLVQGQGIHFPGMLSNSEGVSFDDLAGMKPFDAWAAVPDAGKTQIFMTCLIAEIASEAKEVHYTKGGPLPTIVFPPIDMDKLPADKMAIKQNRELNNGRLAMIAMASIIAASTTPGSVPAFSGMSDIF